MLKLRVQPIHTWTIGQTAAFPAFQLTSEATANCLQQSEASSRNYAKELQNAKSRCVKTTLRFSCTQNLEQTLSSGFHSHFLITLVQLSSYSTSESGHHQTKPLWKEMGVNEDNSPKQAVGTMRKNCGTRSLAAWKQPCAFCVLKTLHKLCAPNFIHTF